MSLKVNGARLHTHVNRIFGGNAVAGIYGMGVNSLRSRLERGAFNNFPYGSHAIDDVTIKAGVPNGYRPPYSFRIPQVAGALSSHSESFITVTSSGSGAEGLGGVGASTVTINASAIGGLIAGGVGSATVSITANGSIIASVGGVGSATITIGAVGDPGAIGWLDGDTIISLSGSLASYAIGHMEGTTEDSGLTVAGIVNGVWNALADENNEPGSMGELLNNSGAGANPWTTEIENNLTALEAMRLMLAALAGKLSGADGNVITIRNAVVDDKNRIVAITDDDGNRISITYDVS